MATQVPATRENYVLARLSPLPTGPKLGSVVVTVGLTETHTFSAQVAKHPIEDGSKISDHRTLEPVELKLDGIIGDPPKGSAGALAGPPAPSERDVQDAFAALDRLYRSKDAFQVVTGLKVYDNMVVEHLTVTRDKTTGLVVQFTAQLVQIRVVGATTVRVVAEPSKHAPVKDAGRAELKPAPDQEKMRSSLRRASDAVIGKGGVGKWVDGLRGHAPQLPAAP